MIYSYVTRTPNVVMHEEHERGWFDMIIKTKQKKGKKSAINEA